MYPLRTFDFCGSVICVFILTVNNCTHMHLWHGFVFWCFKLTIILKCLWSAVWISCSVYFPGGGGGGGGGGVHSAREGGLSRVTYFAEEGVLFKTSTCPRFCKRRVLFCTQVRSMHGSDAVWLPKWLGFRVCCDHLLPLNRQRIIKSEVKIRVPVHPMSVFW